MRKTAAVVWVAVGVLFLLYFMESGFSEAGTIAILFVNVIQNTATLYEEKRLGRSRFTLISWFSAASLALQFGFHKQSAAAILVALMVIMTSIMANAPWKQQGHT